MATVNQDNSFAQLRPIPTKYRGITFRSRLEARWAVFFDVARLKWEYEPEGFQLPSGLRYLPDFRVEHFGWVEIKPDLGSNELLTSQDRFKLDAFARALMKEKKAPWLQSPWKARSGGIKFWVMVGSPAAGKRFPYWWDDDVSDEQPFLYGDGNVLPRVWAESCVFDKAAEAARVYRF